MSNKRKLVNFKKVFPLCFSIEHSSVKVQVPEWIYFTDGDLFSLIFHPYHQSLEILFPNPGHSVSDHSKLHIAEFDYINEKNNWSNN